MKKIKHNLFIIALLTIISKLAIQDMLALNASWNVKQFIELFVLFYMYIKIVIKIK
jgi:hypothetical protein